MTKVTWKFTIGIMSREQNERDFGHVKVDVIQIVNRQDYVYIADYALIFSTNRKP